MTTTTASAYHDSSLKQSESSASSGLTYPGKIVNVKVELVGPRAYSTFFPIITTFHILSPIS